MGTANHPLPVLAREDWQSLNGPWGFRFDDGDVGMSSGWQNGFEREHTINVPFCYQSKSSGVGKTDSHRVLWYQRELEIGETAPGGEVLLHFGAVDHSCTLWINGQFVGEHTGGGTHFFFAIGRFLRRGNNVLVLRAVDSLSCELPRGKQCWSDELTRCWYTPTSGIWRDVWLERTGDVFFTEIKVTPDVDARCASIEARLNTEAVCSVAAELFFAGRRVAAAELQTGSDSVRILLPIGEEDPIDDIHLWSPERPALYDLRLRLTREGGASDEASTYFGMRKVEARDGRIFLNGAELYQRLVLDQGYWTDSLMTPPDEQHLIDDLLAAKRMGFNGVRMHQKFEDPRFYYQASRLGMIVWGECPSAYVFSALSAKRVIGEWQEFVAEEYNSPCILTWVPYNESWGVRNIFDDRRQQALVTAMYHLTKALDPTRLVSSNDGWETVESSDVLGLHDYESDAGKLRDRYRSFDEFLLRGIGYKLPICRGNRYRGQPVLITEYGGIAFEDAESGTWGYHAKAASEEEFLKRLDSVTASIQEIPYCCGFCYTQLTDVMQETNGLLRADRTRKLSEDKLFPIFARKTDEQKP